MQYVQSSGQRRINTKQTCCYGKITFFCGHQPSQLFRFPTSLFIYHWDIFHDTNSIHGKCKISSSITTFQSFLCSILLLLPYFLKEHFQMTSVVIVKLQDGLNKKVSFSCFLFFSFFFFLEKKEINIPWLVICASSNLEKRKHTSVNQRCTL